MALAHIVLEGENTKLDAAEREICVNALEAFGDLHKAALALGVTPRVLKRRIIKHAITWPREKPEA
jgi:transcriptional regulator with GAF, ATPase, and Fis domain